MRIDTGLQRAWRFSGSVCLLVFTVASLSDASFPVSSETRESRESRYQISSHGFRVGELKTVMRPVREGNRQLVRFVADQTINAGFLFFSLRSVSREEALISEEGTVGYRRNWTENGRTRGVEAEFLRDRVDLTVKEEGKTRNVTIPRSQFDFTTMDCPETTIPREGGELVIRLLDLEHARVVRRRYVWTKTETVTVGELTIRCRVVDFEDPDNRCRRWITRDPQGVIIARQEGKGKAGTYILKMTSLGKG